MAWLRLHVVICPLPSCCNGSRGTHGGAMLLLLVLVLRVFGAGAVLERWERRRGQRGGLGAVLERWGQPLARRPEQHGCSRTAPLAGVSGNCGRGRCPRAGREGGRPGGGGGCGFQVWQWSRGLALSRQPWPGAVLEHWAQPRGTLQSLDGTAGRGWGQYNYESHSLAINAAPS